MENTPQKKQYNLSVMQFISSCNKCRKLFYCDLDRLYDGMQQSSLFICRGSTKYKHPKARIVLGFAPIGSRLVGAVESLLNTGIWGAQGNCQTPHRAGVLHISLLSSISVQPTKQLLWKALVASWVSLIYGQSQALRLQGT